MACNAEDDEESLQDNFFKQRQKYMGVGGFSRVQRFGNVTWDRKHPTHHSRWTDRGGDNFFKIDRYNYNHRPVPYSEDSVYNAINLQCNANKVRFNENCKRHTGPSYLRWNRSPVMRHNENSNIYEYNQSADDVDANSTKLTGQGHYYPRWESKGSSSRKIKEISKEHECDRLTDTERRKWDKMSPSQRLVGDLGFDKSSEIKRRKLDNDPKDQIHSYYSRRYRGLSKPVQKVIENAQHRNHPIKIEKNCKIVTKFERLAKENVVVKVVLKRTDGKEASNSNSQQEDQKRNSTPGILESKPHDPFRVIDESVSVCEKFENNTISVENTKTFTGMPDSIKELSSTGLLDSIQRTMAHSVQKNIEIESCSQIEEQSTACALKVKDKIQLSKDVINFSHTNNMNAAEDDRIADLDAITFPEQSSTVSNHIRMDRDSDQKNSNESQDKVVVISPHYEKCRFTIENSEKNKVSIVKLDQSELGERPKIIEQKSFEKDQESCIEFIAAKQVKRRKSDETFNRSKHNSLNNKTFMSNVKSKESKTTDTIVDKNQGKLFDSFCYLTLPFISSERRHFDLSKKERKETINEHNDNHSKCEAISFTVARSATIGHSQEISSCAKIDGNKTNLMYCGEKTKNCVENTVDITKMDSSSTKTGTDENNEVEDHEQHPKHEKGSESNTTVDRSINNFRALNLDKQRHSKHTKLKVNHKHLKHTLRSKKVKSAKQALMISSKMCKKVYTPSEMEVIKEKRKFQEKNNKKINPAKKIRPIDIAGSDKENVDVKRVDNVESVGQDKLIEECIQIQQVTKVNLDEENVTLNKEINLQQGCTVLKAVQTKDSKQNRNLKVDEVEIDDEEEDYTIIDLNVAPATPYPMTPGLSKDVVAPLQEYEDCGMDTEKAGGLASNSVCNMQTQDTEIKGHTAHLLQFIYNPDTSDISDDDFGEKHFFIGESNTKIDDSNSSVQNTHNDEDKEELKKDAIMTKFKRQQPNKEERRMRMERLEEAYMQLTIDATNGKENERSVSKKRKNKEQHHKTKQKSKSGTSISLPDKRKTKNFKSKTLSVDKGKCLRNGELAKNPDDKVDTSKDEKNDTKLSMVNSLITQEAGEMQHRKDEGSLDSTCKDSSSKNDFLLHHYINSSEKVFSDMENVDNSEAGVDSGQRPGKAVVSDLKATQNYSDKSTDVTTSITAAERSDALAHQQIWQNGFEFIHDLILMDGRKITTKGHIEPKLMNVKEKNMIRCQVCEKYMTPRSFMYHHDNSNIIKQIDIKRSVSNPPKPDPEDIIIWNSGAGDIWEYFLKEISVVDQVGKDRQTLGKSCEKESHQVTGLCSTNAIMVGENVYMPSGDDQRLVSSRNAVDNLQISSSYALGFIAVPAATLMISSGSANNYQIMSKQAQVKRLRDRSENSHLCKSVKSQQSLKNLEKNPLANKSGFTKHHVSDNNLNFTSRPNASVDIVQDAHNCNLQGGIYLQSSGSEKQVKYGSLLTSIRHEQMQNQLRIKALQANILALLGKSKNESFNSGTSPSDGRGELKNDPTRLLVDDAVAACAEKQQFQGDSYGQQDAQSSGQCAVGRDLVESQARNCNQVADDQIKRVTASSYSCNHRSMLSPVKTTIYNVPSPAEMRDYNTSSVLLDDRSGNQNEEAVSSSLGPLKVSSQPLNSFETYSIPSASSLDTRSHLSTCFMQAQNEVASNTTMNDSVIATTDTAAACRKHFGSQQAETPVHYSNLLYSPPVTNNQLAVSIPSHTMIGNQSVSLKNTLSSLDDEKSKLHLMVNNKLSVSSASKENALSMGFATGYEKPSDKIANSEPQGTPAVSKSASQSSSEAASIGNVNTKRSPSKAGPSKTISALDKLINEIDFQTVKDLEPFLMLAKKLEIKCMHEMMARSRHNQAVVAELTSTVQSLQHTNDNGKT